MALGLFLGIARRVLDHRPSQDTPKQEDSMSQLITSRREFAGVSVTMTTATAPLPGPDQPRRVVALGWISRNGGQVTVSDRLTGSVSTPAGR